MSARHLGLLCHFLLQLSQLCLESIALAAALSKGTVGACSSDVGIFALCQLIAQIANLGILAFLDYLELLNLFLNLGSYFQFLLSSLKVVLKPCDFVGGNNQFLAQRLGFLLLGGSS